MHTSDTGGPEPPNITNACQPAVAAVDPGLATVDTKQSPSEVKTDLHVTRSWAGEASNWLTERAIPVNALDERPSVVTPASQAVFDQHIFEEMCAEIKNEELCELVKRLGPSSIPLFTDLLMKALRHLPR
jgi:hypothetical protein